jgi:hypothetical protein
MDIRKAELIDLIDMQINLQKEAQIINQNLQAISAEIVKRRDEHVVKREGQNQNQKGESEGRELEVGR